MRALGVESDKSIIEHCLLDLEKNSDYVDLFVPCIHDAGQIFNQITALKYIATFTKGKTIPHVLYILMDYLLPHIGEINFREKAFFLGHMVFELLKVFKKIKKPTDRDSFKYKRVELAGELLYDLFREYYTLEQRNIYQKIDKEYYYKQGAYQNNFVSLIETNYRDFFKDRIVESGFKKAFKGISHYSMGNTGFIDVTDLTKIMVYLMKNSPPNENYICISSHLTFKAFFDLLCVELGKRVPKRKASTSLLEIGWRLDWLKNKIFGKDIKRREEKRNKLKEK